MTDCKYRLKEKMRNLWRKIGIEEEAIAVIDEMSAGNTDLLKDPSDNVLIMFYQFGAMNTTIGYMASEFGVMASTLSKYFNEKGSGIRRAFEQGLMGVHLLCMDAMKFAIKNGDWRAAASLMDRMETSRLRLEADDSQEQAQATFIFDKVDMSSFQKSI